MFQVSAHAISLGDHDRHFHRCRRNLCGIRPIAFGPAGAGLEDRARGRVAGNSVPDRDRHGADGTIYLGQDPMDMPGPVTTPADSVVSIKDGRITVFAESLWAVMGLEWVDDTLYVVHSPYLSAFRDTDHDGKADQRIDLVTGLGPKVPGFNGINDHIASGIRLGIDGFLYISVGDKGIPEGVGRDGTTIRLLGAG